MSLLVQFIGTSEYTAILTLVTIKDYKSVKESTPWESREDYISQILKRF